MLSILQDSLKMKKVFHIDNMFQLPNFQQLGNTAGYKNIDLQELCEKIE